MVWIEVQVPVEKMSFLKNVGLFISVRENFLTYLKTNYFQ